MRPTRILGVFLILVALVLVGLLVSQLQIPEEKTNPIWKAELVGIRGDQPKSLYVTLHPSHKKDYRASGFIILLQSGRLVRIDVWIVNETRSNLLIEAILAETTPPYSPVLTVTDYYRKYFEVRQPDYDGDYYFVFNSYYGPQDVVIALTESWVETSTLVESSPLNLIIIFLFMVFGIYLLLRRPPRRRKFR